MHVNTRCESVTLAAFNMGAYRVPCLPYFNLNSLKENRIHDH
jgi:hypothetical protein